MYKYSYNFNMVDCTTGQWECINRTEAEAPQNIMYISLDLTASTLLFIKFITTTKTKLVWTKSM